MTMNHENRQTTPLISVVCPTYNSAAYVADTIQSVLNQTVSPLEFIVSDDGSSDNTVAVVEHLVKYAPCTVQILRNPHQGPGAARNSGIRAAKGEWIAFLDSDDRWKSDKVGCVLQAILEHPEANFFCHNEEHIFLNGSSKALDYGSHYKVNVSLPYQLFRGNLFSTSAVVCRRDLLLGHGLFDEELSSAQDYELWIRISPFIEVHFISDVLGYYVDRRGNISSTKAIKRLINLWRALSKNKDIVGLREYSFALARQVTIFIVQSTLRLLHP